MKYVKKFYTTTEFNNFIFNHTNTPNVSLIEGASGTDMFSYKKYIPPHNYALDYFTIVAIDNIDVCLTYNYFEVNNEGEVQYSIDNGNTWNDMTTSVSVSAGNKILLKHNGPICNGSAYTFQFLNNEGGNNEIQGRFNVEGNIMSLIYGDNFVGKTSFPENNVHDWGYIFYGLFSWQTNLINAGNLILPVIEVPYSCYFEMFGGCTSLITAPELPATILSNECYSNMFHHCTSLTTAPELPALILTKDCYYSMFNGCSSLNYVKCLATDISAYNCLNGWLESVNSMGTFIKNPNMTSWPTGDNGIPSGWIVQDA